MKRANKQKVLLTVLFFILSGLFSTLVHAEASFPEPPRDFYVLDEADVLSQQTEEEIVQTGLKFEQTRSKPQIVVLTVESLEGLSVEEYATEIFDHWNIGQEEEDNGILVLFAREEREIKLEIGYGLEGRINDSKAGRILDDHLESLKENEFDRGIQGIYTDIVEEVRAEYLIEEDSAQNFVEPSSQEVEKIKTEKAEQNKKLIIGVVSFLAIVGGLLFFAGKKWVEKEKKRHLEEIRQFEEEAAAFYARHHNGAQVGMDEMVQYKLRADVEKRRIEKEKRDREHAISVLEKKYPGQSITNQMIQAYLVQQALELKRKKEEQRRKQSQGPFDGPGGPFGGGGFSGGGGSFGGGGSSGGGGASRGF